MRTASRVTDAFGRAPPGPILAVVAVAVLWAMSTVPSALERVPDVKGLPADAASVRLAEEGFAAEVVIRDRGGVTGTVLGQDPGPGEFRQRGAVVTLEISRGARQVRVPDVKGMPVDEARSVLTGAGLRTGQVIYRALEGAEPGRVVETEPPAGSDVDEGTEIDVISALG